MEHKVKVLRSWASSLIACLLCSQTCLAQTDAWERVKLIEPGRNVRVKLRASKSVKGKMDAWRADGMSVRQGKKIVSIEKVDVEQVGLLIGRSRARKALLAGAIAGGAGAALMGAAAASGDCCEVPAAALVAGGAIFYGGVAAGIAALFPQHVEVMYSEPARASGRLPNVARPPGNPGSPAATGSRSAR